MMVGGRTAILRHTSQDDGRWPIFQDVRPDESSHATLDSRVVAAKRLLSKNFLG